MTRYDFEDWLRHRLSDLPREELDRIAAFYMDAIEARMEDGMTEEQAIYDLGEPEALLEAIRADLPEYTQTTYQPVRQSRQSTVRRGKWIAAGVAALAIIFALPVLLLVLNASPRYETITEEVLPPMVDEGYFEVSDPDARTLFDATTLEKVTVAASFGSVQVEPSEDGDVQIVGDPAFYEAVRRGNTLYIENVEADFIVKIPDHVKLEIKCDVGNVTLYEIVPQSLNIYCDLGSIELHNVSAVHSITLEADCGSIEGSLQGAETDYEIDVEVDLGQTNLSDSYHSGDEEIKFTATADLGNINITFEE
mgnify:CR=1 FL=1